ncbi:serine/threonine-protein kinase [Bailinhaonella thermotolerans]|nr:serine/threonine-protein kinase [Bailinhaonella thermotolerans]
MSESLLVGRYRLLDVVGAGGMGSVWRARDELLGRQVAVKEVRLPPGAALSSESVERTLREARSAARLNHPGIITVHDVVESSGRPWIVMELVDGHALEAVIPRSETQAAKIVLKVLDALEAAHRAGVLHRDIKPANILLSDSRVVLTDFGIAVAEEDPSLTATGQMLGSPAYMSPERLRGRPATAAADLWSVGATLYAAVEGVPPFQRESLPATLAAIVNAEPLTFSRAAGLRPVIGGLLHPDPALRLTAEAAAEELRRFVAANDAAGSPHLQAVPHLPGAPVLAVVDGVPHLASARPTSAAGAAAGTDAPTPPDGTAAAGEEPAEAAPGARARPGRAVRAARAGRVPGGRRRRRDPERSRRGVVLGSVATVLVLAAAGLAGLTLGGDEDPGDGAKAGPSATAAPPAGERPRGSAAGADASRLPGSGGKTGGDRGATRSLPELTAYRDDDREFTLKVPREWGSVEVRDTDGVHVFFDDEGAEAGDWRLEAQSGDLERAGGTAFSELERWRKEHLPAPGGRRPAEESLVESDMPPGWTRADWHATYTLKDGGRRFVFARMLVSEATERRIVVALTATGVGREQEKRFQALADAVGGSFGFL